MKYLLLTILSLLIGTPALSAQDGCFALALKSPGVISDAGIICISGFGAETAIPLISVATLNNWSNIKYCGKSTIIKSAKTSETTERYSIHLGPQLSVKIDLAVMDNGLRKGRVSFIENDRKIILDASELRTNENAGDIWNSPACIFSPIFRKGN